MSDNPARAQTLAQQLQRARPRGDGIPDRAGDAELFESDAIEGHDDVPSKMPHLRVMAEWPQCLEARGGRSGHPCDLERHIERQIAQNEEAGRKLL